MPKQICEISASIWLYYKEICYDARSRGRKKDLLFRPAMSIKYKTLSSAYLVFLTCKLKLVFIFFFLDGFFAQYDYYFTPFLIYLIRVSVIN